jgi:hypothetical protein
VAATDGSPAEAHGRDAVAVADPRTRSRPNVLAAALLLPGIAVVGAAVSATAWPTEAHAEVAPTDAELSLKLMRYQDRQPGLQRTGVRSPALGLVLPITERWSLQATAVQDTVSGASPRYHTAISGASVQTDQREAVDLRLSHHGDGRGWTLGVASSDENDYRSRSASAEWRWFSEDRNRSLTTGLAYANDRIGATGQPLRKESRETWQALVSVTQAWTVRDLLQATFTFSRGQGYHSDPYKIPDERPRERDRAALLLRWNHHLPAADATARTSWRLYGDSYGVRAQTVELEWAQGLGERWTLGPALRLHSQRAASFYVDPPPPGPDGLARPPARDPLSPSTFISADARLAGFGAASLAFSVQWRWRAGHWLDLRLEQYEQRSSWRVGGRGSPGIAPLSARHWQIGTRVSF